VPEVFLLFMRLGFPGWRRTGKTAASVYSLKFAQRLRVNRPDHNQETEK